MENSVIHSGMKVVPTIPSGLTQNDVATRQSRAKVTVAFTEVNDRARGSVDFIPDAQTHARKSGMVPLLRRGSRKQTLSLNPEEREALENLIEEVIMDGMGDGGVDSDGSSSDGDDRSEDIFDKENPSAGDGSNGNDSSKLDSPSTAPSVAVGGKKYYPGQLKVALKHMTNLPPRFVRKLAKAQHYLDACSADDPARPTATIVGSIEEEEEGTTASHGKDEVSLVLNSAYSPGSGQPDRDKDKTKKETKLQEAKKQIRTLLCDKDQYVDEKSAGVSDIVAANAANVKHEVTVDENESSVETANARPSAEKKNEHFFKAVETSVKQLSGVSKFSSSAAAITYHATNSDVSAVCHVSQSNPYGSQVGYVQAYPIAPTLSANVPDFMQKGCASSPVGYNGPAGHGTSFVRFARDAGPMSPVQRETSIRNVPTPVSAHDPRYYVQPPVLQGQSANYYGLPQVYNTPPPATGMPSRIMSEMLPSATSLIQSASVNGVGLNQSGSYSMPGRYSVPAYSTVFSSPYPQNAPQSMQTGMYPSFNAASQSKPMAYQINGGSYCTGSSADSAGAGAEYQYIIGQPGNVVSYPRDTVSFVSFNGAVQGRNSQNRMSTPRAPGSVEFTRKSHGGHGRYSSGISSATPLGRSGPHRFSHACDATSAGMSAPKNISNSISPVVKFGSQISDSMHFAVVATCLPSAVSSTPIASCDNAAANWQLTSLSHTSVDYVNVSPSSVEASQHTITPKSCRHISSNLETNFVKTGERFASKETAGRLLDNELHCVKCVTSTVSSFSNLSSNQRMDGLCATNKLQDQHFPATLDDAKRVLSDKSPPDGKILHTPMTIAELNLVALETTRGDETFPYVAAAELSTAHDQVSVSSELVCITADAGSNIKDVFVEEVTVVTSNLTELPAISDCLKVVEPSHSDQDQLLESGAELTDLITETGFVALQDNSRTSNEVIVRAHEVSGERIVEQASVNEADCSSKEVKSYVSNSSERGEIGSEKSSVSFCELSEVCHGGVQVVSHGDANIGYCDVNHSDITLSEDVVQCSRTYENTSQSTSGEHGGLLVKLSSDFVRRLMHLFGDQEGRQSCPGANGLTPKQVFLSSDVLRQIYLSMVDLPDETN